MNAIKEFYVDMLLLSDFNAIKLFFHYLIIWFIIESIFYTAEQLLGVPTIIRWYDAVLTAVLIALFLINVQYLISVIKKTL